MEVPYIGRQRQLDDLSRRVTGVLAGRGAVVVVLGEAGIGKSALLDQFRRHVIPPEVPVLLGRAVPDAGAPAFWPWLRACGSPAGKACGLPGGLLMLNPLAGDSAAAARFAAITDASEQLLKAAMPAGMVVILEDLHWADDGSLQLLDFLSAELADSRLLVVATARDVVRDGSTGFTGAAILRLEPLTRAEVGRCLGEGVHPTWPSAVQRRTGGNPLYVTQLVRHLEPADLRAPTDGRWPLPNDLVGLVSIRLNQLSNRCRRLLDGASVAGEEFDLEAVNGDGDAAAEAVAAGVLVEDRSAPDRLQWTHDVIREACYDRLSRGDRIAWHRQIAERLERRGTETASAVAHHRLRSAADNRSRAAAVSACKAAAEAASRTLDFTAAGFWHSQTLPLVPDDSARAETWLSMARAAYHGGRVTEALERCLSASDAGERLGRADLLAEAAVVVQGIGGLPPESIIGMCERARAALGAEVSGRHARVLAQHARILADTLNVESARPLSETAMQMAVRCGDADALMEAMHARHEVIGGLDGVAERLSLGARLIELAAASGSPHAALWGHIWRVDAELQLGATSELLAQLFDLGGLASRTGWPLARWHLLRAQATRAIQTGRFDQAAQLALACQQVAARSQDSAALTQSHLVMTELQTLTGRFRQHEAPPLDWHNTGAQWLPVSYATYGWHVLRAGRLDRAQVMFEQVRPQLMRLPVNARWMATVMRSAELAVALGDAETAELTYRLLLPYGEYYGGQSAAYLGAIPRVLGVLASAIGDHEAVGVHGTAAISMERRVGAAPFAALAELAHAQSLLARGWSNDRSQAATLLAGCLTTARRLDMRPAADAASRLLAEVGGASAGPATLTAREREIAAVLADGLSNREIAKRLVLSDRTVETHVRNILSKLAMTNRAQVAAWAVHVGLRIEGTSLH